MVSVTKRISKIQQPRGGYLKKKDFEVLILDDKNGLNSNENIHSSLVGMAVDYLTRYMSGLATDDVFRVARSGSFNVNKGELFIELISDIRGLDDISIINACKIAGFDVAYRVGAVAYRPVELIEPNEETIANIRIMVKRGLRFFEEYGPIALNGFSFEGGYTSTITTGDGDFLTKDTLWDFKVSINDPLPKHTLQLLVYYLLGIHSKHREFSQITRLGIFNPRLNKAYVLCIDQISNETIEEVETVVIGY